MIPVFRPKMEKDAILAELGRIFDSGWIGLGPVVNAFEERFAAYVGTKYAVAVNSCTAALHLACLSLGVGNGDEVIVPPITFVSTALAPMFCGAKPVFADIDEETLCIDPVEIEKKITAKTKAIIPVHYGGHACQMDEILDIAKRYGLFVIEDCAHACGGKYKGRMLGSIGNVGCFSFHAVKNLSCGDGGMITLNDEELYHRLKKLRWVGIDKDTYSRSGEQYSWRYSVDTMGFKCHMNDITAVIGLAQLRVLDEHNGTRRVLVEKYNTAFESEAWILRQSEKEYARSSCHNYVIRVSYRDEMVEYLGKMGISTGVHYEPLTHFNVFGQTDTRLPVTESVWPRLLTLPLFPDMTDEQLDFVVAVVKEFGVSRGL